MAISQIPPKNSPKPRGRSLAVLFMFIAGGLLVISVTDLEEKIPAQIKKAMSSKEERTAFRECQNFLNELKQQNLPSNFQDVSLQLIDPLPGKAAIGKAFSDCLKKNINSPVKAQIEIFSSDYEGKDGDTIVAQMSIFDLSSNKVSEINVQWKTDEFIASDDPPSNPKIQESKE